MAKFLITLVVIGGKCENLTATNKQVDQARTQFFRWGSAL